MGKNKEEVKYFMWFDSSDFDGYYPDNRPYYGPHYFSDEKMIGKKTYHTLDDLLKTSLSDSVKKRLKGARVGTEIKAHYLHSSGDLMLVRITEDQTILLDEYVEIISEITCLDKKKTNLKNNANLICKKIFKNEKE